jgi:hypothetical protein
VRRDGEAGVRQVVRGGLDADVEQAAVICLADEAHAGGDVKDKARFGGDVMQQDEAGRQQGVQALAAVAAAGQVTRPPARRPVGADVARGPQALGGLGPVVGGGGAERAVLGQPAGVEVGAVPVGPEGHLHGRVGDRDLVDSDVRGHIGDRGETLPGARVPAARARAVDPQPDRGQAAQRRVVADHFHGRISVNPAGLRRNAGRQVLYERTRP